MIEPTDRTLTITLNTILKKLPELRESGVTKLTCGDIVVEFGRADNVTVTETLEAVAAMKASLKAGKIPFSDDTEYLPSFHEGEIRISNHVWEDMTDGERENYEIIGQDHHHLDMIVKGPLILGTTHIDKPFEIKSLGNLHVDGLTSVCAKCGETITSENRDGHPCFEEWEAARLENMRLKDVKSVIENVHTPGIEVVPSPRSENDAAPLNPVVTSKERRVPLSAWEALSDFEQSLVNVKYVDNEKEEVVLVQFYTQGYCPGCNNRQASLYADTLACTVCGNGGKIPTPERDKMAPAIDILTSISESDTPIRDEDIKDDSPATEEHEGHEVNLDLSHND